MGLPLQRTVVERWHTGLSLRFWGEYVPSFLELAKVAMDQQTRSKAKVAEQQ